MKLSGQTPIYRARNLEKYLGVEKIYLKLEGSNPTNHKNDRVADTLLKYVSDEKYNKVLIHGTKPYIISMLYFAQIYNVDIYCADTEYKNIKIIKESNINWVRLKVHKNWSEEQKHEKLKKYANTNDMYYLSEFEKRQFLGGLAIQKMCEECILRVNNITDIWLKVRSGFTIRNMYYELVRNWANKVIDSYPIFRFCYITANDIDKVLCDENTKNIPFVASESLQDIELKDASKLIRKLENIVVSKHEVYPLALMIKNKHLLKDGSHVVILNDGKSNVEINEISKNENININEIVNNTIEMLKPYNDSYKETEDAVKKAIKCGYIFIAETREQIQGICIVVNMGFKDFIPTYHLAYIGVKSGNSGKGVATELLSNVIEKTDGNVSLHVDIPNVHAKKLYEKMGFRHCYNRMIYNG